MPRALRLRRSLPLFFLPLALVPASVAEAQGTATANRWEATIERFEAADRESPPAPGAVLFTGSSSIVRWATLAEDFPGVRTLNRGFGGSRISDVRHFVDRIILPYRPSHLLVYAGDNDIAAGRTAEEVFADFAAIVERVHEALPELPITWISIKPSPSRWDRSEEMIRANALVRELTDADARLHYVDVWNPMIGVDGTPPEALFVSDMLHMSPAGYAIWKEAVAPVVERVAGR